MGPFRHLQAVSTGRCPSPPILIGSDTAGIAVALSHSELKCMPGQALLVNIHERPWAGHYPVSLSLWMP